MGVSTRYRIEKKEENGKITQTRMHPMDFPDWKCSKKLQHIFLGEWQKTLAERGKVAVNSSAKKMLRIQKQTIAQLDAKLYFGIGLAYLRLCWLRLAPSAPPLPPGPGEKQSREAEAPRHASPAHGRGAGCAQPARPSARRPDLSRHPALFRHPELASCTALVCPGTHSQRKEGPVT